MTRDLPLTSVGTPAIVIGKERYPLVMTIAGMKKWAERSGQTFDEMLKGGWNAMDLKLEDIAFLLKEAMRGGEKRRVMFDGGEERDITDDLVLAILDSSHPGELVPLLVALWNEPPVRTPDPQSQESSQPGE